MRFTNYIHVVADIGRVSVASNVNYSHSLGTSDNPPLSDYNPKLTN